MSDDVTCMNTEDGVVFICNNCGAHAFYGVEEIEHHRSCTPGDAKKWEAMVAGDDEWQGEGCGGARGCTDKEYDRQDPACKECLADYYAAMDELS